MPFGVALLGSAHVTRERGPLPARLEPAFGLAHAQTAASASGDTVVARVGESTITRRELEKRLSELPRALHPELGSTPREVRRAFLEQVLIPDALFAEEAKARKIQEQREIRNRVLGVLRLMLVASLRKESKADGIEDEDVRSFYEANRDRYAAPRRFGLHRILVATEVEAQEILKQVGATPDTKVWNDLAREKSLDKASRLRGGSLGLVSADGGTGQAGPKLDPALFAAAEPVKDGEVVPTPVREGDQWAVVWKRQTTKPSVRSLELEASGIRANLADERLRGAIQELLGKLRSELVSELNPELTGMVSITANGDLERAKRPGVLPRSKRQANATPVEGPAGLR